jgi:hypothetical protein
MGSGDSSCSTIPIPRIAANGGAEPDGGGPESVSTGSGECGRCVLTEYAEWEKSRSKRCFPAA